MVNDEWTRDDLPSAGGLAHTYAATSGGIIERFEVIVDEVVLRLNVRHPKGGCECDGRLAKAIDDLDRMRWARDTAVARAEAAERALVEARIRAEADARYSGTLNHAFVEGALWATRHLDARNPFESEGDRHVDQ